jgi:hypothetical protein
VAARIDPVEIIARVSEDNGKQRAFEVWIHKATKAGWPVTVESASLDRPGSECGVVQIEGLRYRIHHAKRIRQRVAATVKQSAGETVDGTTWTWTLTHAAWAEPVVDDPSA